MTPGAEVARILVVDADPALRGLLEEWLAEEGCRVIGQDAQQDPDLVVFDLPLPRQAGASLARQLAARHPGKRLVALSSNFFAGVETNGAVARTLGVDAVLPKPLTRQALIGVLRRLLPRLG
jgi:two-component system, OmpR family, phosphate regulon response regulator OmpR